MGKECEREAFPPFRLRDGSNPLTPQIKSPLISFDKSYLIGGSEAPDATMNTARRFIMCMSRSKLGNNMSPRFLAESYCNISSNIESLLNQLQVHVGTKARHVQLISSLHV